METMRVLGLISLEKAGSLQGELFAF